MVLPGDAHGLPAWEEQAPADGMQLGVMTQVVGTPSHQTPTPSFPVHVWPSQKTELPFAHVATQMTEADTSASGGSGSTASVPPHAHKQDTTRADNTADDSRMM
ncbi:hypothetical protein LXT21_08765 [Myxococcus sp. K38C18041901]|uniref:hypothetical protein n=1 Tax=Myxococcus guangdongensis TaxID=2906760 RepID=UPI0020A7923E|nr:hypothetical protein [Myxococcus guangdongensis]MCP3058861.1 hypothetical protein [Myxococcus guangdongensis]